MADLSMRTFFTSLVIREMQVETTGYHFTPRRMAQIENLTTLNPDMDREQVELCFLEGGMQNGQPPGRQSHEVKRTLAIKIKPMLLAVHQVR